MAYEKQEWKCGDTLTADKLNHMEQGIEDASQSGGGSEIVNATMATDENNCFVITLDKTASELYDIVFTQGKDIKIFAEENGSIGYIYPIVIKGGSDTSAIGAFSITVRFGSDIVDLKALSLDDYPTCTICPNEGGSNA